MNFSNRRDGRLATVSSTASHIAGSKKVGFTEIVTERRESDVARVMIILTTRAVNAYEGLGLRHENWKDSNSELHWTPNAID